MQLNIKNLLVIFIFICGVFISISAYPNKLHHEQFAELVFGQSLKATALKFTYLDSQIADCQYVTIDKYPEIEVMLIDGVIERIETNNTQLLSTSSPFYQLANNLISFTAFKKAHPQIEIVQHEYQNGHYLRWYNDNQSKAIVVDYVQGKVTNIKAGLVPSVLFVEGCA